MILAKTEGLSNTATPPEATVGDLTVGVGSLSLSRS
jgi:hypothetical protein